MSELKRSINKVQINGTLEEINLKEETKEATIVRFIDGNKVEKKINCRVIGKVEFKNPAFTVSVNGNTIPVEYFGVNFGVAEKALDEKGDVVDNKNFKALETIMNKYVPKVNCKNDEVPTRVKVDGSLTLNEYASTARKADGEFFSTAQVMAFGITSNGVTEEDSADAEISGVIKTINHEEKNEQETGRLNVELVSFGYNGVAEPFKFVVEEDLAGDFESFYELGSSVKICYEITTKQVGTVRTQSTGGFGRRNAKITSGYTVTEYSIFSGELPYEEESEYYVDVKTVKEKLEERQMVIDNKIKEAVEKANEADSKPKSKTPFGASKGATSNPFGGTTKKQNPFA